jgi:hypothetical protein
MVEKNEFFFVFFVRCEFYSSIHATLSLTHTICSSCSFSWMLHPLQRNSIVFLLIRQGLKSQTTSTGLEACLTPQMLFFFRVWIMVTNIFNIIFSHCVIFSRFLTIKYMHTSHYLVMWHWWTFIQINYKVIQLKSFVTTSNTCVNEDERKFIKNSGKNQIEWESEWQWLKMKVKNGCMNSWQKSNSTSSTPNSEMTFKLPGKVSVWTLDPKFNSPFSDLHSNMYA